MSRLLRDYLNGTLQMVETGGPVNGQMDFDDSDENSDENSDSEPQSDTEQKEYVQKEMDSYFSRLEVSERGGLTDIDHGDEESILGTEICQVVDIPRVFSQYRFDNYYKKELPIDSFKEKILTLIDDNPVVIIHGNTGCGKTTQVPQYIIDQCKARNEPCNIVVTQPRRIAAINISQRVCEERGWSMGTVCGYQVGLDRNVGEDVILTYVTTEVLLQKLIFQKNLNKYTHIVIDEVHERSKSLDFLLLIVRKYLYTNSNFVKVILMSATMEAKDFAFYFRSIPRNREYLLAPVLHINQNSEYTVNYYYVEHLQSMLTTTSEEPPVYNLDQPYISQAQYTMCLQLMFIFDNVDKLETVTDCGHHRNIGSVLVFLPGFHEIEEMHKLLIAQKGSQYVTWEVIPLHSHLSSDQMTKAFQKPKKGFRKIILSTNIAESSVTVADVNYVIDFCLTKVMKVNAFTKFSTLSLEWASHNNCIQRAGRVGRVANGRVYRLVPLEFYKSTMEANTTPELQRAPLENIILYMKMLELNDTPKNVLSLALSPPNLKDIETCIWHLKEVGALLLTCKGEKSDADGDITFLGKVMGNLPIDIHFAKMIVLGHMFSCLDETVIMAAGCMTRNLFVNSFTHRLESYKKKLLWADGSCSDFLAILNLYNVWLKHKQENSLRSLTEEYAWCKTNYVNLKGLREWEVLIREINMRLKRFGIVQHMGAHSSQLSATEKPTVLKVVICGAFYPYYYVRSSEYGQIDTKQAVKTLNGRNPYNSVYLTSMKLHHPGQIYIRQIKKLLNADDSVQIGFDEQSSKVYVEFRNSKMPEPIVVGGRHYLRDVPGNICKEVYEAVRRRQLRMRFDINILPDHKAWKFAETTMAKIQSENSTTEDLHISDIEKYSPLPTLDVEYISVCVSNIIDAGHFYCQNNEPMSRKVLDDIYVALNGPGAVLEPIRGKADPKKYYAAIFSDDGKLYRCKILLVATENSVHVMFIDYGNVQSLCTNQLFELPDVKECYFPPIAMSCVLSEVQPCIVLSPKGLWSERANNIFRNKTQSVLLNAKVYSVVDNEVHLELFLKHGGQSFNEWLIQEGYGQRCEESYLSKVDHEKRRTVITSENPNQEAKRFSSVQDLKTYTDFEAPSPSEYVETISLKGPFSPLEMKVGSLMAAGKDVIVRIEDLSVNAVLLDESPEDAYSRLVVAARVGQSASCSALTVAETTIMPNLKGLPMLMTLLFCPQMEPKATADGSRIASILCGLGHKEYSHKANFAMHDIVLTLDTELTADIIIKVNELRYAMNGAIKKMSNIADELDFDHSIFDTQEFLKTQLFQLLHIKQNSVPRVNVKFADQWTRTSNDELEILQMDMKNKKEDIWPLLWFVKLNKDKHLKAAIEYNLSELMEIAKKLIPEKEIECKLCECTLFTCDDVRIHIYRDAHKEKLAAYKNAATKKT